MQAKATNKFVVKFFVAAVIFLGWGVIQGALQAQKAIHDFLTQGPADIIVGAHSHINLLGWVSLSVAGLIYYLVPILTNKSIAAPRLTNWIFGIWVTILPIMAALMIAAGIAGGRAFGDGTTGAQLDSVMGPYMMPIGILSIVLGLTLLTFVVQILVTVCRKVS
jgi:cbb3-type cytochrome oxidase subunit 1